MPPPAHQRRITHAPPPFPLFRLTLGLSPLKPQTSDLKPQTSNLQLSLPPNSLSSLVPHTAGEVQEPTCRSQARAERGLDTDEVLVVTAHRRPSWWAGCGIDRVPEDGRTEPSCEARGAHAAVRDGRGVESGPPRGRRESAPAQRSRPLRADDPALHARRDA